MSPSYSGSVWVIVVWVYACVCMALCVYVCVCVSESVRERETTTRADLGHKRRIEGGEEGFGTALEQEGLSWIEGIVERKVLREK